jgi:aminomethyltransferase
VDRSALLSLHEAEKARLRPGGSAEVLTFGDVPGEYRVGIEGCVVFDATDRGAVLVRGAETFAFLHRLLTSDVLGLDEGRSQESLLLSSKGKVLFGFRLYRTPEGAWLSVPPRTAPALLSALETYHFAEKVEIADQTSLHAPLLVCGPAAADVLRSAGALEGALEEDAFRRRRVDGVDLLVARIPVAGSPGFLVDAGPEAAPAWWKRIRGAGARAAGVVAREILRVEAGQALYGEDVDENVYPQEARLEAAFSLTKGCFIGQEVVAKIDTYGGLNKRLVGLRISHSDPVARGTRLVLDEEGERRELGVITSWAYSFALDTGLALGYAKRRHQKPGTIFLLGEGAATAEIVKLPVRPGALALTGEFE